MSQNWTGVIILLSMLIMGGGLAGIYSLIIKQNAVVGARTLQLVSIVLVVPLILALSISNVLGRETTGPLLGVVLGYVLSGSWKE